MGAPISGGLNVGGFSLGYGGGGGGGLGIPGLGGGFLPSISPSATATDSGYTFENTPVTVIAGNSGGDPVALINAAANLSRVNNEPIEQAVSEAGALAPYGMGSGGGLPSWVWYAAGGLLLYALLKGG